MTNTSTKPDTTLRPRTQCRLSPELLRRIDALDGCRGRWVVDCRALDLHYYRDLRSLTDSWQLPDGSYWHEERGTPEAAARYCAATGWAARLLWCSDWLDDDARWPGGYDAPSIVRSNARVFREEYREELERADGDADGLSLDIRYVTPDMIETLHSLESYPLLAEDDHSELELELIEEAWESWAKRDWRGHVEKALQEHAPEDADAYWADEILDSLPDADAKLRELFEQCREAANTYWEEETCGMTSSGYWVRLERCAAELGVAELAALTGLPLLPADQQWRREPYPWPGAPAAPLVPALTAAPGDSHG